MQTLAVNSLAGTLPRVLAQAIAAIALGLMAASGIAKFADPDPTTGAMAAARLPASRTITFLLALGEVAVAGIALAAGGPATAAAGIAYLAFSIFTFAAMRKRIPVQSCGCFGREDTPPSWLHVGFNVVSTVALFTVAATDLVPIDWGLPVLQLSLYIGFSLIGVVASYLMLTRLPQTLELAKSL